MSKTKGARPWGQLRKHGAGWQAAYTHECKRHYAPNVFGDKMAAEQWLIDERALIDSGKWTPPDLRAQQRADMLKITVASYADEWLNSATLRDNTRRRYAQEVRLRIVPTLGDVPLVQLDKAQVAAWWRGLDHKHVRACDIAYATLRTMLNRAKDDGLIETNPCQVRGAGKPSQRRVVDPLTPAQVAMLADAMPERLRLAVLLGAWCGLRSGEVRELRRKDIDVKAGTVKISRQAVRLSDGRMASAEPKTDAGRRTVPIPGAILEDVKEHVRKYAQIGPDGLLFYGPDGAQISGDKLLGQVKRRAAKIGLHGVRFHDLRHVGLTYAAVAGATVRELQTIAGHTTPAMAMRYQEVARDHMADVVDKLSSIIEGGQTHTA